MNYEQQRQAMIEHGAQMREVAARLTPERRADLLLEVVQGIYHAVKLDNPEGGGLDGRDGPERMSLAAVADAAQEHHHTTYQRQLTSQDSKEHPSASARPTGGESS